MANAMVYLFLALNYTNTLSMPRIKQKNIPCLKANFCSISIIKLTLLPYLTLCMLKIEKIRLRVADIFKFYQTYQVYASAFYFISK